jgi:cell division protease FtsH
LIDAEVQRIIDECHREAKGLLLKYRAQLDKLVNSILAHETLDEKQILEATGLSSAAAIENQPIGAVGRS